MPWIVYETVNKLNGKKYVGVHKQDGDEFDGYLGSGKRLMRSIKKHGVDAFERSTLFSFDDEDAAYDKEAEIVTEEWCSRPDTYNIKVGGFGGFPNADPEFRAKASERSRAMHADPEFRAKNSERARAMNADPEFRAKHSARMRAMNADPEFRAKNSERARAMNADPEFKARSSERASKRMRSMQADPEFRAKNSERARAMNADPEFRAKHSARMRAMNADPEFKARQLAGVRAYQQYRRREKANSLLCILDAQATEGQPCQSNP
jgi:hypothetical protein